MFQGPFPLSTPILSQASLCSGSGRCDYMVNVKQRQLPMLDKSKFHGSTFLNVCWETLKSTLAFLVLTTTSLQLYSKDTVFRAPLLSSTIRFLLTSHKRANLKFHIDSRYEGTCYNSLTDSPYEENTQASCNSKPPLQMCQHKESQVSDGTYLRVPFSPLSRLVKRLYRRVIWLWETEGRKRTNRLARQCFLVGIELITLNYCYQKIWITVLLYFLTFLCG